MKEIASGIKRNDGIIVVWEDGQWKSMFFNYGDLIDQKINALDLLDHPKQYMVDENSEKIMMKSTPAR